MALVSGEAAYVDAPSLDTEGWELPLPAFVLSTRDLSVVAAPRRLTKFPALDLLDALHTDRTGRPQRRGAFRVLDRLRDEGVILGWGLGVNRVEPIELLLALEGPRPDGFLLAGRYTLLDHARALQRVMPEVASRGLGIVVGGPYSSGALVGGPNFEYAPAKPELLTRVAQIKAIADRHHVSMKAAGLQFALAHPAVVSVIPGASKPARIAEDSAALRESVPADFWRELRVARLVSEEAPLPSGA